MKAVSATEKRQRLRALISTARIVHPASVFDPLSARCAQDEGFEVSMLAGSVASLVILGAPDLVIVTLSELAALCRRICRAADLPLLVDADHGFGNALSVQRTVQELEAAGVAAMTIEDTQLPGAFGTNQETLVSIEEATGKITAAIAARTDPETLIVARTSLPLAPLEDIVARVRAYETAGADAIFLSGPKTRAQISAIAQATRLPLVLGRITRELDDADFLTSHRVRLVLQGHKPCLAAIQAMRDTLRQLAAGVPPAQIQAVASDELVDQLTRRKAYDRLAADTLGG
ncbi:MAG: isocitrate lyase/PEP mutase family protein [Pigmentiphaga sp.]|uniref:isocitrate lyase/PEP mutase family protein n=1 Tax=Pigmentiphaga sp. TaxID=1977564 RepID=UPI0029A265FD|nr:isocitrate lyase/PEP mutase family protein [Pigmentiphaga sp.]MDX3907809.1 isocitrate lyase/PEP mutase family protein [Pigmentiphaga sp.]